MPGLKRHYPDIRVSGNRVTPDEIDRYEQYVIGNLSDNVAWFGTVAPGTVAGNFVIDNTRADYPRNVHFSIVGPAGGVGGTASLTGKNQFGVTQTETLTIGSANGGGTVAGTKVFAQISAATYAPNGVDNTGTPRLGYTAAATTATNPMFGLPAKLGGTADIKAVTWVNNGTATVHTAAAAANVANHAFVGTVAVAKTHQYVVLYKPTYNAEYEKDMAGL